MITFPCYILQINTKVRLFTQFFTTLWHFYHFREQPQISWIFPFFCITEKSWAYCRLGMRWCLAATVTCMLHIEHLLRAGLFMMPALSTKLRAITSYHLFHAHAQAVTFYWLHEMNRSIDQGSIKSLTQNWKFIKSLIICFFVLSFSTIKI